MLRPGGLPTPAWADGDRTASGGWSWPPRIRAPCRTRPPGTWSPTWPGPADRARKTAPGRLPAWPRSCASTASGTGPGKATSRSRTSWAGPASRSAPMSRSAATRPWSTARSHFAGPPGSPNTRRSMTRHRSPGPAAERGGADAADAAVPPPPAPSWPRALRAIRAWLSPWIALQRWWPAWSKAPPPRQLQALGGGDPGGIGDLVGVGEVLPGQGLLPEDPPPALLHVQPAGALGDERVPDAGMILQPGPGALAVVAGQVVGDHPDRALGIGLLLQLEEVLVILAVAGRGAHGDRLPVSDAQPAVDPGLLRPAGVLQRRLDPVPAGRPARGRREGARDHRAELAGADHGGAGRRGGVELHDAGPFSADSGSVLVAQLRVRRQRTFSASKIRRTWLRPAWMPASRAVWARVSRVHCAGPRSSSADSSPSASRSSRPGGTDRASAMMADRCASVIRRLRPAPGRSPSTSRPAALNRCSQRRTVF